MHPSQPRLLIVQVLSCPAQQAISSFLLQRVRRQWNHGWRPPQLTRLVAAAGRFPRAWRLTLPDVARSMSHLGVTMVRFPVTLHLPCTHTAQLFLVTNVAIRPAWTNKLPMPHRVSSWPCKLHAGGMALTRTCTCQICPQNDHCCSLQHSFHDVSWPILDAERGQALLQYCGDPRDWE